MKPDRPTPPLHGCSALGPQPSALAPTDTIAAIATAPGAGAVGIVRLSGPRARAIGECICGTALRLRRAQHVRFADGAGETIDDGIVLYFAAPASYTGEDVVELQAHGSPAVLQQLLVRCRQLGARDARAGEFSERAWLGGKLDLAQAEAVADLIAAGDVRAARAARRSLDGEFSQRVDALAAQLLRLRVHVEAAIDFADEPLDTLGGAQLACGMDDTGAQLDALLREAERGRKLRDGLHAVIVGPPNAGKSSLLNALAGSDRAIVTEIAGTTRDLLTETIRVDGVELTLVDTAGLRESDDIIETEGIRRAHAELQRADLALVVVDARNPHEGRDAILAALVDVPQQLWVHNKRDLLPAPPRDADSTLADNTLYVSARTGAGLSQLHARLRALWDDAGAAPDGAFSARARHVDALHRAAQSLDGARAALDSETLELAAEALRVSFDALGEITGKTTPDCLLGHIFSTFCVGK